MSGIRRILRFFWRPCDVLSIKLRWVLVLWSVRFLLCHFEDLKKNKIVLNIRVLRRGEIPLRATLKAALTKFPFSECVLSSSLDLFFWDVWVWGVWVAELSRESTTEGPGYRQAPWCIHSQDFHPTHGFDLWWPPSKSSAQFSGCLNTISYQTDLACKSVVVDVWALALPLQKAVPLIPTP